MGSKRRCDWEIKMNYICVVNDDKMEKLILQIGNCQRKLNQTIPVLSKLLIILYLTNCQPTTLNEITMKNSEENNFKIVKSADEWKEILTPEQYHVLRESGTERPFTGEFNMHFEKGIYTCAGCGEQLFDGDAKFDAQCGWPSFDREIENGKIIEKVDRSHGMIRTEILCGSCGGHLGHVFEDGPTETGLRYCVNSLSLGFDPS